MYINDVPEERRLLFRNLEHSENKLKEMGVNN